SRHPVRRMDLPMGACVRAWLVRRTGPEALSAVVDRRLAPSLRRRAAQGIRGGQRPAAPRPGRGPRPGRSSRRSGRDATAPRLWRAAAGGRARLSHALYFNPRDPHSTRWSPLAEIRPGPGELAQVQRLTAILSDPGGVRDGEAIWDKAASEILEAVILHVLYTA